MNEDILKDYRKAGKIAAEALDYGIKLLKDKALIFDVVIKIEEKIKKLGGELAFPINVSFNNVAAHYTPLPGDQTKVNSKDLVKLDVGVHVNGYIGDNAKTIGPNKELIKAAEDALAEAIKLCKPGTKVTDIGKAIEDVITKAGFNPIRNLSGHGVGQFETHSPNLNIPNFDSGDTTELKEDDVIAIEPFATNGIGMVKDNTPSGIYQILTPRPTRVGREVLVHILDTYKRLPFVARWIPKRFPAFKVRFVLNQGEKEEIIHQYPRLVEKQDGLVAQAEHTVLITKDSCEVLTKND
jgi:methionyl aminopeptidase